MARVWLGGSGGQRPAESATTGVRAGVCNWELPWVDCATPRHVRHRAQAASDQAACLAQCWAGVDDALSPAPRLDGALMAVWPGRHTRSNGGVQPWPRQWRPKPFVLADIGTRVRRALGGGSSTRGLNALLTLWRLPGGACCERVELHQGLINATTWTRITLPLLDSRRLPSAAGVTKARAHHHPANRLSPHQRTPPSSTVAVAASAACRDYHHHCRRLAGALCRLCSSRPPSAPSPLYPPFPLPALMPAPPLSYVLPVNYSTSVSEAIMTLALRSDHMERRQPAAGPRSGRPAKRQRSGIAHEAAVPVAAAVAVTTALPPPPAPLTGHHAEVVDIGASISPVTPVAPATAPACVSPHQAPLLQERRLSSLTDDQLTDAVAAVLGHIMRDTPVGALPDSSDPLSLFYGTNTQPFSLEFYIKRVAKHSGASPSALVVALALLQRWGGLALCELNIHRAVTTAVMLAAKWLDDVVYSNGHYASVGGVPSQGEMNALEVVMLTGIHWNVAVGKEEFEEWEREVVRMASLLDQPAMPSGLKRRRV